MPQVKYQLWHSGPESRDEPHHLVVVRGVRKRHEDVAVPRRYRVRQNLRADDELRRDGKLVGHDLVAVCRPEPEEREMFKNYIKDLLVHNLEFGLDINASRGENPEHKLKIKH